MDKNKNRKGLSASEFFSNAGITDLTDKELKKIKWWKKWWFECIFIYGWCFYIDMWC